MTRRYDSYHLVQEVLDDKTKQVAIFQSSLNDIVKALDSHRTIEGVNIAEKVKDPDFRFVTQDDPEAALALSHYIAGLHARQKSVQAQKADTFALAAGGIIENIRCKQNPKSDQELAHMMNDLGLLTPRGAPWSYVTIQNVSKRYRDLKDQSKKPKPR